MQKWPALLAILAGTLAATFEVGASTATAAETCMDESIDNISGECHNFPLRCYCITNSPFVATALLTAELVDLLL
jgi:hypothetical protein